jgi:hypothetical protein
MPRRQTLWPPTRASTTTAVSASAIPAQRSSIGWSWSARARITVRMSNGFFRSGLLTEDQMSPTVAKSLPSRACGEAGDIAVDRVGGRRVPRPALTGAQ